MWLGDAFARLFRSHGLMTRKYFQMLAETVADLTLSLDLNHHEKMVLMENMEEMCFRMNSNFKPSRFSKAVQTHLELIDSQIHDA